MTNAEYVEKYPEKFEDELDKWLFREFSILGGCCSSIEELKYSIARKVAEKAMADAKEQMMKDAIEVTVHIDAGGYPYIPQIELYDYDEDIPLAKEGDKYKVILINED